MKPTKNRTRGAVLLMRPSVRRVAILTSLSAVTLALAAAFATPALAIVRIAPAAAELKVFDEETFNIEIAPEYAAKTYGTVEQTGPAGTAITLGEDPPEFCIERPVKKTGFIAAGGHCDMTIARAGAGAAAWYRLKWRPKDPLSGEEEEEYRTVAVWIPPLSSGHYFSGGLGSGARIPAGEKVATIAWGTLSLTNETTGARVSCHNVVGAVEENPEPGGAEGPGGVGETQSFAPYDCESEACTAAATGGGPATYISVFAEGSEAEYPETGTGTMTSPNTGTTSPTEEPLVASGDNLKWNNVLFAEGTKIRRASEAKLNVICHVNTGVNAKGEPEFGAQGEEVAAGADSPLGVTHCCTPLSPPELSFDAKSGTLTNEKGQKAKIEGSLKTLGYAAEEIINSKPG